MAKRGPKSANSTSFKEGHTPHPKAGRPPVAPEIKAMRATNAHELSKLISFYYNKTIAEVEQICAEESVRALELHICTFISKSIRNCDPALAKELLDRMAGRPKEQVIISDNRDEELTAALGPVPEKTIVQYLREVARVAA